MEAKVNVTVLGVGVTGLTTALLLSRDPNHSITLLGKSHPGDYDIEYASPWAGANFGPVGKTGTALAKYERYTWPELNRLAKEEPDAGIHFQPCVSHFRDKDTDSARGNDNSKESRMNPPYKDYVPDWRILEKHELPPGVQSGTQYTSVCINTTLYLHWLMGKCLKNGVVVKRGIVNHVVEAAHLHHSGQKADVVINCTGLSSLFLGGVQDKTLRPARGQIVVVRNECGVMRHVSGTDDGPHEEMYMMQRAAGGGTVLGGSYQKDNWESQPDPNLATRIMKRCVDACPVLTGGGGIEKLSVIRHSVGLRPLRDDGIRLELETIEGVKVVHNYGHAGYGYQTSYGCAEVAQKLFYEALGPKARL